MCHKTSYLCDEDCTCLQIMLPCSWSAYKKQLLIWEAKLECNVQDHLGRISQWSVKASTFHMWSMYFQQRRISQWPVLEGHLPMVSYQFFCCWEKVQASDKNSHRWSNILGDYKVQFQKRKDCRSEHVAFAHLYGFFYVFLWNSEVSYACHLLDRSDWRKDNHDFLTIIWLNSIWCFPALRENEVLNKITRNR